MLAPGLVGQLSHAHECELIYAIFFSFFSFLVLVRILGKVLAGEAGHPRGDIFFPALVCMLGSFAAIWQVHQFCKQLGTEGANLGCGPGELC